MICKRIYFFIYASMFLLFSINLYSSTPPAPGNSKLDLSGRINSTGGFIRNTLSNQNEFYYGVQLSNDLITFGIPLKLDYNIITGSRRKIFLQHFSMEFTKAAFLEYLNNSPNFQTDDTTQYARAMDSISHILNNEEYLERISECQYLLRQMAADSASGVIANNQISKDSLLKAVEEYKASRNSFNLLKFKPRNIISSDQGYLSADSILRTKGHNLHNLNRTIDSSAFTERKEQLHSVQRVFNHFEEIKIGYHIIDQSYISVYNYPISGATAKYKNHNLVFGATGGLHQRFYSGSSFTLLRNSDIFYQLKDKQVLYQGLAGYEDSAFSLIGSFSTFRPTFRSEENLNMNQSNSNVINVNLKKSINDNSSFKLELSKSLNRLNSDKEKYSDIAISVSAENTFPAISAHLSGNYLRIGKNFDTPGNIYLQKDFQSIKLNTEKQFLKERIELLSEFSYAWCNLWTRQFLSLGANCRLFSKAWIQMRNLMNEYTLLPSGEKQTIFSNQVSVNMSVSKKVTSGITGYLGKTTDYNNERVLDYQQTLFSNLNISNSNISIQVNHMQKKIRETDYNNYSASLSFATQFFSKFTIGLVMIESLGLSYTLSNRISASYKFSNRMAFQTSFSSINYYQHTILNPYDLNYQYQGTLTYKY